MSIKAFIFEIILIYNINILQLQSGRNIKNEFQYNLTYEKYKKLFMIIYWKTTTKSNLQILLLYITIAIAYCFDSGIERLNQSEFNQYMKQKASY